MRIGRRAWAAVAAAALAACAPDPDLFWVLREPEVLAIRVEVIKPGRYDVPRSTVPTDRVRAEPMPTDTLRVEPFFAGPDGVIDPATVQPLWLACNTGPCALLDDPEVDVPACEGIVEVPVERPCLIGVGPSVTFELADFGLETGLDPRFRVRMVSGSGGEHSTDECFDLHRNHRESSEDFRDCLHGSQRVSLGPPILVQKLAADLGLETRLRPEDIPPEALENEPNYHLEIPALRIDLDSGSEQTTQLNVPSGARIEIDPGTEVLVTGGRDPRDRQPYFLLPSERGDPAELSFEPDIWRSYVTPEVEPERPVDARSRWTAPEVAGELTQVFVLYDTRGGVDWAWLDFEVRAP